MNRNNDYLDGYDAGWELEMGDGLMRYPPLEIEEDAERLANWNLGFSNALSDS